MLEVYTDGSVTIGSERHVGYGVHISGMALP